MPKILILDPCQVNFGDERGGVHVDHAETPSVTVDTAKALVGAGRAVYVDKKDDPDKKGRDTATEAMLDAAEQVRKARKADARKAAAVQTSAPSDEGDGKGETK